MNKSGHVLNGALLAMGLGAILAVDPTAGPILTGPDGTVTAESTAAVAGDVGVSVAKLSLPVILGALFPDVDTAFGRHRKTLHSLPVLGIFLAFPLLFGNLQYVWIGVATHYFLDVVGSKRGIALFHPLSDTEYNLPTGVATSSAWATRVTLLITAVELTVLGAIHYYAFALDTSLADATTAIGI
ncbi:membrane protein [Halobellus salinus]|uniref:Membrane protein n=1 Tax=Halobellus salinus TaxID=931585 RepID=A0A830EDJ5_9EURY|nr:metal-dependent hydrolase [Halobellus salinus]GGI99755.1 membrane protein [Halobellus salinus]SMP02586.1 LexA-binding, inner membrane-associated putative hydrolase [Halobellus salinus]